MKKTLAILFVIVTIVALAVAGCASRNNPAPTSTPAATASPTIAPTGAPTINATAGCTTDIDASLADMSGEGDEGMPELDIPTPSAE